MHGSATGSMVIQKFRGFVLSWIIYIQD